MFFRLLFFFGLIFPTDNIQQLISASPDLSFIAANVQYYKDNHMSTLNKLPLGMPIKDFKRVSDTYGYRVDPITGKKMFHSGIDIAADLANIVYSTADGVVKYAGIKGGYGQCIIIRHLYGYSTIYAHLSYVYVKPGQLIKKGKAIGFVGSTGRSTGNHLHYEVRKNNKSVYPYILML